ncbi:hypothetical protein KRR40_45115 [Niabella defluvii]|nr:hypothetical protein KRR40_45115 [Niabella sp. I65]
MKLPARRYPDDAANAGGKRNQTWHQPSKKRGLVKLGATLANNTLELKVENTGRLKEQQQGGGFGIRSIRERLKLMYGNNAMFNIKQSSDNTVTATLKLPVTL